MRRVYMAGDERFQSTPDYLNRENNSSAAKQAQLAAVSIHSRLFKPGEYNLSHQ